MNPRDTAEMPVNYAPCPTCQQYSHSIGEHRIAEAFNHFQSMIAHSMGNAFDDRTRDMAQVLVSALRHRDQSAERERVLRANIETMEEQRRRCKRWEKSHCELDIAIEQTLASLTPEPHHDR